MSAKIGSFFVSSLICRRSYGVYARAVNVEASAAGAVATAKKTDVAAAEDASSRAANKPDKLFWMRDPKTGCWVPENRFEEEVDDVVDLRNRLIVRHK